MPAISDRRKKLRRTILYVQRDSDKLTADLRLLERFASRRRFAEGFADDPRSAKS